MLMAGGIAAGSPGSVLDDMIVLTAPSPRIAANRSASAMFQRAAGAFDARPFATATAIVQRAARSPLQCGLVVLAVIGMTHSASDGMLAMCAIFAASLVSSTAGFAFSGLCGAALFHVASSPARAVEIMLVCSVANQAMMTWSIRHHIVWRHVARYASGGTIGVVAGIAMAASMASTTYVLLAGGFLSCYGAYSLVGRPPRLPALPPKLDILVGLCSGFFGGMLAFPSVLVVIWLGCKGEDRHTQRAIYQPFILLMQIVAIAALMIMAQLRPGSSHFAPGDLLYMPVALLGTTIGLRLFSRATDRQFKVVVSAMLIVSGAALLV